LPNAIDAAAFAHDPEARERVRRREGWDGRFVVGHVGRFSAQKNHPFLIDIFERVVSKEPLALLVLVGGGGDMEGRVRKEVARRRLTHNVVFTGPRDDIADLLRGMDVFVFPSRFEGLGIAQLEAQAAGVKTINSRHVPREGIVVPELVESLPLDLGSEVWAMRVLRARESPPREDRRAQIAAAGFDIDNNAQWLEGIYLEAGARR
jgi:glycosyltransferase involved in cell wall biosynthesis